MKASFIATLMFVASTSASYAEPGVLVTDGYAKQLHKAAKITLENGKLDAADLDQAIRAHNEKYYRESLAPKLEAADPFAGDQSSVDTSDRDLIAGCDDYAVALVNEGSAFFDAHDPQEVVKWKVTADKAANQCQCIVNNPATVQNIVAWRDAGVTIGTKAQQEAREANANRYLAMCSGAETVASNR